MTDGEMNMLREDAKQYVDKRCDLLRLSLVEKLARVVGLLVLSLVLVLLIFGAFSFLGMAAVFALGKVIPLWLSCCIMALLFLLLIGVSIVFVGPRLVRLLVRQMSEIFLPKPVEDLEKERQALTMAVENQEYKWQLEWNYRMRSLRGVLSLLQAIWRHFSK